MPKRSYPFSESFSSQYKIHVGQKELNLHGVFGNKYRQEVYEKTKNLLFNGTKAMMSGIWKADIESHNQADALQPRAAQMLLRGQTCIGLDGKLKKAKPVPDVMDGPTVCGVCQRSSTARRPCLQCDRSVCLACTQQCSSCSNHCCSVCSVTDYTERYDKVLCFSCSS